MYSSKIQVHRIFLQKDAYSEFVWEDRKSLNFRKKLMYKIFAFALKKTHGLFLATYCLPVVLCRVRFLPLHTTFPLHCPQDPSLFSFLRHFLVLEQLEGPRSLCLYSSICVIFHSRTFQALVILSSPTTATDLELFDISMAVSTIKVSTTSAAHLTRKPSVVNRVHTTQMLRSNGVSLAMQLLFLQNVCLWRMKFLIDEQGQQFNTFCSCTLNNKFVIIKYKL